MSIKIKLVTENDIPSIAPLFPKDWHFNFSLFLKTHNQSTYFKGFTISKKNKPIGFGNLFIFNKSAWLGNIVIDKNYRSKGYGRLITKHLIGIGKQSGIETFILIATDLGRPVYEKLGFEKELNYEFYSSVHESFSFNINKPIVKAESKDLKAIIDLDFSINGENRQELLKYYLPKTQLIYQNNNTLRGLFIDSLESGSIISDHQETGIELLKLKLNLGSTKIIIPEANTSITDFLKENGFKKHLSAPQMIFGKKYEWHPEFIFSRGAGYCG